VFESRQSSSDHHEAPQVCETAHEAGMTDLTHCSCRTGHDVQQDDKILSGLAYVLVGDFGSCLCSHLGRRFFWSLGLALFVFLHLVLLTLV
jgi:hypothetical protein